MARYKIENVEGIGPAIGEKLRAAGIARTEALLTSCRTPVQRAALAEKTGGGVAGAAAGAQTGALDAMRK